MRKALLGTLLAGLLIGPASARAGGLLEASAGSGVQIAPSPNHRIPTNLMLTGGYSFAGTVKLEVGLVGNLADVKDSRFDLDVRPMIVLSPPLSPVYVRGIFGVTGLKEGPTAINYGGALGLRFGALGLGAFVELGALSRRIDTATGRDTAWIGEGRLGAYWD